MASRDTRSKISNHWFLSTGPQLCSRDVQHQDPKLRKHLVLWTSQPQLVLQIISFSSPRAINAITLNAG